MCHGPTRGDRVLERSDPERDWRPVPAFRVVTCSGCGRLLQAHIETLEPEAEGKPERYIYVLRRP